MFCRKCGARILADSIFCPECGTKVETVDKTPVMDVVTENEEVTDNASQNETITNDNNVEFFDESTMGTKDTATLRSKKKNGIKLIVAIWVVAVILIIIIVSSVVKSSQCEYYRDCSNEKADGSDYCYSHLCEYSDCIFSKGYSSDYCYSHQCSYTYPVCDNCVATNSEYCSIHTCDADGCYNEVETNSSNCSEHQINMRDRISSSSMNFSLNSAGGIKFNFSATNKSGKTIKYVRFNVYLKNAVGDPIEEDITNEYYAEVEIIGPIDNWGTIKMSNEIIGYCDNLARIDIRDITIVYTDGTSETGYYGYYYKK